MRKLVLIGYSTIENQTVVFVEDRDKFLDFVRKENMRVQVFDKGEVK
jgi:hypothetical protein